MTVKFSYHINPPATIVHSGIIFFNSLGDACEYPTSKDLSSGNLNKYCDAVLKSLLLQEEDPIFKIPNPCRLTKHWMSCGVTDVSLISRDFKLVILETASRPILEISVNPKFRTSSAGRFVRHIIPSLTLRAPHRLRDFKLRKNDSFSIPSFVAVVALRETRFGKEQ